MIARALRRLRRDDRGTATIELAGVGTVIILSAMNAADVGRYAYQSAQVSHAAQAGAEAALVACNLDHTPATINCPGLNAAVTAAIQGTRLGSYVMLNGPIDEAYYCRTTAGGLAKVGPPEDKPTDCDAAPTASASATPTLYLKINVAFTYQPMFNGITVATSFSTQIARTGWMRMA